MAVHQGIGTVTTLTTSGTSARSGAIAHKSDSLRFVAVSQGHHVAIGTLPTGSTTDYYIPSGGEAILSIGRPASQRVVNVIVGTATTIDFPEGTGSPFFVGQRVSLTVTDPQNKHFEFTDKPVASINNTANVGGFFGTRLVVTHSYGAIAGVHTAFVSGDGQTAELRDVVHISALAKPNSHGNAATGAVHFQQVQVTSGA